MITCTIIDDEPLAVKLIESYVLKTDGLVLVSSYSNAIEALEGLRRTPVDLIFCDIQMPDLDGLKFAELIDTKTQRIIFTTAFSQYAIDGYKVEALDYLLKPINYVDFVASVERAKRFFAARNNTTKDAVTRPADGTAGADDSIFVKSDYKLVRIRIADILYIEGLKDYIKIHLSTSPRPVVSLISMHSIEETLASANFMRIHRSFIVNLERISVVERSGIVFGDRLIPVSESYKEKLQEYLSKRTLGR